MSTEPQPEIKNIIAEDELCREDDGSCIYNMAVFIIESSSASAPCPGLFAGFLLPCCSESSAIARLSTI